MASLHLRQLDDDLVRRLEARAAAHGRSAEAEHRAILEEVLGARVPKMTGRQLVAELARGGPMDIDFDRLGVDETPGAPDFT